jgi:hypothetical protein
LGALVWDKDFVEQLGHPAGLPIAGRPDNHRAIKPLIDGLARRLGQKDAGMTRGEVRETRALSAEIL